MILEDLSFVEKAGQKPHWRFSVRVQIGRGTLKTPGWRYYPETEHLMAPRRNAGGRWVPSAFADKDGLAEVTSLIKSALEYRVFEFDGVLNGLEAMEPDEREKALAALAGDSCFGAAIVYLYRRLHEQHS